MPAVRPTPKALQSLVTSVPAKTLHTYLLDNIPAAPPKTLAILTSFFAALSPPPPLHCVRCHKDYTDTENNDRSCRIPHEENDCDISWVGGYGDSEYVTTYVCCGIMVEGEGDDGPPGWCFVGMHTTDIKRARFREDADTDDDKLESCFELNCHNIRARAKGNADAGASTSKRAKRTRPSADDDDGFEGTEDTDLFGMARRIDAVTSKTKSKGKSKASAPKPKAETVTAKGTTEGKVSKRRKVAHTATA